MPADLVIPSELVAALAEKTENRELQWAKTDERKFSTELSDYKLSLGAIGSTASGPDIIFEVDTPDGVLIGIVEVKVGDPNYQELWKLLNSAEVSFQERFGQILTRAAISLKESTSSPGTTPPPMPPRPSDDLARRFFEKIAGEWFLDYSRGVEFIRIDALQGAVDQ